MSDVTQSDLGVSISESAQEYLAGLLAKQDCEGIAIRMFVSSPALPGGNLHRLLSPREEKDGDVKLQLNGLVAWFEGRSLPFWWMLRWTIHLIVWVASSLFARQILKCPKSPMTAPSRIKLITFYLMKLTLAFVSHNGNVSLVEVTEDKYAVLKFGGGCQGCSAVDITLKEGVEKP